MTKAIYRATLEYIDGSSEAGLRNTAFPLANSGVLKILGVSRSGYLSWKDRAPSNTERRIVTSPKKNNDNFMTILSSKLWSS